jgi:hypothetical protein
MDDNPYAPPRSIDEERSSPAPPRPLERWEVIVRWTVLLPVLSLLVVLLRVGIDQYLTWIARENSGKMLLIVVLATAAQWGIPLTYGFLSLRAAGWKLWWEAQVMAAIAITLLLLLLTPAVQSKGRRRPTITPPVIMPPATVEEALEAETPTAPAPD